MDMDGFVTMLALVKAQLGAGGSASGAAVEESMTSYFHAGAGRFELKRAQAAEGADADADAKMLIIAFSSLGTGVAAPEWRGSLRQWYAQHDVLHVLDPAASWYVSRITYHVSRITFRIQIIVAWIYL